ncbi:MAG: Nif3-like dinuclear metal center hexameric protein [Bacillota bacterium]
MSLSNQQVINLMEELAPKKLAAEWDNVGLQIGSYSQRISKVLVTLDVTSDIIEEAVSKDVDLIISHHPVIFKPLSQVRFDTAEGEIIQQAIQNQISIYVAHTNYDIAPGGLNDILAHRLGLNEVEVLQPTAEDKLQKLVTFIPKENVAEVRKAISTAGAGWIGNYSDCTFSVSGVGTFRPRSGSDPYLGAQGELEEVEEVRLETIVPQSKLRAVIKALEDAHPYEEVAYDLYPVEITGRKFGLGRVGTLTEESPFLEYAQQVKRELMVDQLRVVKPQTDTIQKVAVCSGSGSDLIESAVYKGADLLVTGDLKYHEAENADQLGIGVIDAGHYGTEIIMQEAVVQSLQQKLQEKNLEEIKVISSDKNEDFMSVL